MSCTLKFSDGELRSSYAVISQSSRFVPLLDLLQAEKELAEMETAVEIGGAAVEELMSRPPYEPEKEDIVLDVPELTVKTTWWVVSLVEKFLESGIETDAYSEEQLASLINSTRHLGFTMLLDELTCALASRLAAAENVGSFLGVEQDVDSEETLIERRRNCGI